MKKNSLILLFSLFTIPVRFQAISSSIPPAKDFEKLLLLIRYEPLYPYHQKIPPEHTLFPKPSPSFVSHHSLPSYPYQELETACLDRLEKELQKLEQNYTEKKRKNILVLFSLLSQIGNWDTLKAVRSLLLHYGSYQTQHRSDIKAFLVSAFQQLLQKTSIEKSPLPPYPYPKQLSPLALHPYRVFIKSPPNQTSTWIKHSPELNTYFLYIPPSLASTVRGQKFSYFLKGQFDQLLGTGKNGYWIRLPALSSYIWHYYSLNQRITSLSARTGFIEIYQDWQATQLIARIPPDHVRHWRFLTLKKLLQYAQTCPTSLITSLPSPSPPFLPRK